MREWLDRVTRLTCGPRGHMSLAHLEARRLLGNVKTALAAASLAGQSTWSWELKREK